MLWRGGVRRSVAPHIFVTLLGDQLIGGQPQFCDMGSCRLRMPPALHGFNGLQITIAQLSFTFIPLQCGF